MQAFPSVEEVSRYIIERLLIAGADQPHIFTPGAVDFIFQCSEGIPRQINNICDNAMLAAYSAGEQVISRKMIESVAENLDMMPYENAPIIDHVGPETLNCRLIDRETQIQSGSVEERPLQTGTEASAVSAGGRLQGPEGTLRGAFADAAEIEDMSEVELELDGFEGYFRRIN
jgi:hypothetical protein